MSELADSVVDTVERAAKGGLVVLLVIGKRVVLADKTRIESTGFDLHRNIARSLIDAGLCG